MKSTFVESFSYYYSFLFFCFVFLLFFFVVITLCNNLLVSRKNFGNFTGKHLCWNLFLIKLLAFRPSNLLKKTPTRVFSCETCKIFKNAYFPEHLWTIASDPSKFIFARYLNVIAKSFVSNYGSKIYFAALRISVFNDLICSRKTQRCI